MRKKAKYILASLLMFCFITTSVNAEDECSYETQVELNNLAATVKTVYEEKELDTGYTTYYVNPDTDEPDYNKVINITEKGFAVKVLNITEKMYITVTDLQSESSKDYYYRDSDNGIITLDTYAADYVRKYKIIVKAADGPCGEKELRTIDLIVPRYNQFSEYAACSSYPDFQYCQKYMTSDDEITISEFQEKLESYKKINKITDKEESKESEKNKVDKKKIIIIAGSVLVLVGVATSVIIIRKRSRLI